MHQQPGIHTPLKISLKSKRCNAKRQDLLQILMEGIPVSPNKLEISVGVPWKIEEKTIASHTLYLHKILNRHTDIDHSHVISHKPARERRGHSNQLVIEPVSTEAYRNSFFPRTIKTWNKLSSATVSQADPDKFKTALLSDPTHSSN